MRLLFRLPARTGFRLVRSVVPRPGERGRPDRTRVRAGRFRATGTLPYAAPGCSVPPDAPRFRVDRVRPFEDFFWVRTTDGSHAHGKGAWEVAVRYSHLDLDDNSISGGVLNDLTFGVNWYTNAYTKIVFNYVHSWRQSPTSPPSIVGNGPAVAVNSEANAFGFRAQMDF